MNDLHPRKMKYLLIVLLFLISISLFFYPLIVSIDSIQGFLAYKGTIQTGAFNFRTEVSPVNVNTDNLIFVSWWSPGQWLYPVLLNCFTAGNLGQSAILITIISTVMGMTGFYKIFRHFDFSYEISIYSLLLIFCSYTFYYSFIVYQGGEILSFGIFPWFVYFVLSVEKPSAGNLLVIAVLFVLCFLAKLTLLIYCPLILFCKILEPLLTSLIKQQKVIPVKARQFFYVVPVALSFILIYYFFLTRYSSNVSFDIKPAAVDFLMPLASPMLSVLSLQQIVINVSRMHIAGISIVVLYLLLALLSLVLTYKILRDNKIAATYKACLLVLYAGISVFFIFSYLLDQVDQSSRHFKLLGYLFLPGVLTIVSNYLRRIYLQLILVVVCTLSAIGFVYLKQDWIKGRYISNNFFYRNYDNKENIDKLDKESYDKLVTLAEKNPSSTIFFIEANLDVAMDIPSRCLVPWLNLRQQYFGHGPVIMACIPRETLKLYPDLLQQKFPGYTSFQLIDQTKAFLFYKCQ